MLKDKTLKFGLFTKVLFAVVSVTLRYRARIDKMLDLRDNKECWCPIEGQGT